MSALPQTHTSRDLAAMLRVDHRWVLEQARLHPERWPSLKVGQRVRFTDAHVTRILDSLERRPDPSVVDAIAQETDGWGRPAVAVLREQRRRQSAEPSLR